MLELILQRSCVVCQSSGAARAWRMPCGLAVRASRSAKSSYTGAKHVVWPVPVSVSAAMNHVRVSTLLIKQGVGQRGRRAHL